MYLEIDRLQPALSAYHMDTLLVIAETLGIELHKPVRKKQLVSDLYQTISIYAGSTDFIHSLSDAEREVLKQMVKLNRVCDHRDVALPLLKRGMVNVRGLDSTAAHPSTGTVLQSLLSKGLIMNATEITHTGDLRQFEPLSNFAIPPEVRSKLIKNLSPAEDAHLPKEMVVTSAPAQIHTGNLDEFLRQLFFTWSELRRKPVRLLKSGGIGKRDQRRMAAGLGLPDDESQPRIQLLYAVLKALNLVQIRDGMVDAADNHAVTLFWNTSPVGQIREILSAYPQLDLPVVYNIKPLSAFSYYGSLQTRPHAEIRKMILTVLESLTAASWVPFPLFFAFASSGAPGHLALSSPSLQLLTSNLRWYGVGRIAELQKQFYAVEQEIVLSVLNEMLTLGFVDIGYGQLQNSQPEVMRISELLHAHFTQQPWPESQAQGQVILQPDAQLLAMGPVPLRILANLERVAVREKQDQSVITYRITREGAYQAFQHGETLAEIRGYLEDATGQPLPQNITRSFEQWAEQHERIVVRRDIQILQVASSKVLEQLLEDPVISRYLHRLDDKTAWIKMKDSPALEKRLRALEILPSHSQDRAIDLVNSLHWDGEQLVSRSPLPSLYVTGTMQLIAETMEKGESKYRWALTAESVRHAVASGLKLIDILKIIETMTGTPLSPEWEKRLKAWGKFYGDSYTAQVRLIRLDSKLALLELRSKDRNLSRWMKPLPQSEALAVVKEANWEETLVLLASYGILVREEPWW